MCAKCDINHKLHEYNFIFKWCGHCPTNFQFGSTKCMFCHPTNLCKIQMFLTLAKKKQEKTQENSVVYKVPCGSCNKSYVSETGRGIETRFKEHKRDIRNNMEHSAFVVHADKTNLFPNWNRAGILTT